MAKHEPSVPTGLYMPCAAMEVLHPGARFAFPVMRGENKYFVRCLTCKTCTFFSDAWQDHMGMNEAQVHALRMAPWIQMAPVPRAKPKAAKRQRAASTD